MQAIVDVADRPDLAGSARREEISAGARTYHLFHARNRVKSAVGRVKEPRHFILYRTREDGRIEVGRVLRESMDLPRYILEEFRSPDA